MSEIEIRRTRAWIAGILGGLAVFALALSAAFAPEAMADGAVLQSLGLQPQICPGCPLCGMSRAFSCVTHAQISRAVDFNRGVVFAYPVALVLAVSGPLLLLRELRKRN